LSDNYVYIISASGVTNAYAWTHGNLLVVVFQPNYYSYATGSAATRTTSVDERSAASVVNAVTGHVVSPSTTGTGGYATIDVLPLVSAYLDKHPSDLIVPKNIDTTVLLGIALDLEQLRIKIHDYQTTAKTLADYYRSQGDEINAAKFDNITAMLGQAEIKIDNMISKIRTNVNNPELDMEKFLADLKVDFVELRDYIKNTILMI
jgi:hypothetical protein